MSSILKSLLSTVTTAMNAIRPPFPEIPSMLLLCEIKNRSGLSALSLGSAIIAKLPDIGIPNGPNTDGSINLINQYTLLVAREIVNEIKLHGLTEVVGEPGSIKMEGEVVPSPNGGMTFVGTNTNIVKMRGLNA